MAFRFAVLGLLAAGLSACHTDCPGPPSSPFSSDDAIASAFCLAWRWHADAVVRSVYSARTNGVVPTDAPRTLESDGRGTAWTVEFAAPTARCGTTQYASRIVTVHADGPTLTGEGCLPVTERCTVGLPSAPPASTLVVPAAWGRVVGLDGFDPASAAILAENLYSCGYENGQLVNRQDWGVWSYWRRDDGATYEAIVDFDGAGALTAVRGPCAYNDTQCLSRK